MVPRTFSLFALALAVGACEVTPQDIETWKGTQRGPGKIVAVLVADEYSIELRTTAAIALVEMNRDDTNALRELGGALEQIPDPDRGRIVAGMVGKIREILGGTEERPTQLAIRAKDAGFVIFPHSTGPDRDALQAVLLSWVLADFNGRFLLGENNSEKIIRLIGAPAASALVAALTPGQLAIEKITQLIVELGDPATRAAASAKLVGVATAQAATPDGITEPTLVGMHLVGGRPVVEYLLALAAQDPPTDGTAAAKLARTQLLSLTALESQVAAQDIDRLCAIGMNARLDARVRDVAFDRLADLKNPAAIPRLWPLLAQTDQRLRWRGGELILEIGGPAIVPEFLRKLPSGRDTEYLPEEIGGYGDRICEMRPPPVDAVRPFLTVDSWVDRLIAIQVIGRAGGRQDISTLQQLQADNTKIPGGEEGATVGKEARAALGRLQGAAAAP
ncbi:MAG: hypothetical protein HYY06_03910 [Deltaproteobacteria bacterium]|nr:hypothetical protein [Deltaproteobacteria bacterium]